MYINYKLANGTTALVEVTEEVADFIINDDRLTANADRRERYNCPYHIDAMKFDGMEYAYHETPEKILIRKEDSEQMRNTLSFLTDTQLRRLQMKADGMTVREIAEVEGTTLNAVMDSLRSARKKFKENF